MVLCAFLFAVQTKRNQMLMEWDHCWAFKVTGMQHMQMNWQTSVSMAMLVKFGKL